MPVPVVAIVGRPNVGKSSIFNWLAGRRISIVDPTAGVTRDRVSTLVEIDGRYFELTDTGGIGCKDSDNLTDEVEKQIEVAIELAHVILFAVDVRSGVLPLDEEVGRRLRFVTKPVILVGNKADTRNLEQLAGEFYRLGRGKVLCVSAEQKRGKEELLAAIMDKLPPARHDERPTDIHLKLAIVGRRNTGKSTFINALAETERVIVSEVAGTTRDSVDVRFERDGKVILAIDTAGVRKKKSIGSSIEFYSLARAERSIRRADVVFHFLDPRLRVSKVDKTLADTILSQHKPAIFVVNKWDLMKDIMPTERMGTYLRAVFPMLDYVPIAFVTAQSGKNVQKLLNLAQVLHKQASARVSTGDLNRVVRAALEEQPPPMRQNRRPKVFFVTQAAVNPPTIVLFTNGPQLFDATYQRYLIKYFRDHLPFSDVPIQLHLRAKKRETKPPFEPAIDLPEQPTKKSKAPQPDITRLRFKSLTTETDIEDDPKRYDSELWRDL